LPEVVPVTGDPMRAEEVGSAREEAERLVVAGLGAVSTALQGMEARRQLRALAEQVLDVETVQDLAAGLNGYVSGAGGEHRGSTAFSTGSADCCVCPVCRVIAALRDPSPEFAEQMASAVGDLAVGLTGLLRAFSTAMAKPGEPGEPGEPAAAGEPGEPGEPATPGPVPTPRAKPGRDDPERDDPERDDPERDDPERDDPESRDSGILGDPASHTMSDSPRSGEPGARKPMAKKAVKKAVRRDTGK
jgi:hypothetical protein